MPIQEKPTEIEFTYTSQEFCSAGQGPKWHVKFHPSDSMGTLSINPPNPTGVFPVEFFVEVVDFLRSKKLVAPSAIGIELGPKLPETFVTPPSSPVSIQLPQVVTKDAKEGTTTSSENISATSISSNNIAPLTSLIKHSNDDIADNAKDDIEDNAEDNIEDNAEDITDKKADSNIVVNKQDASDNEVFNRPVIRTRVKGDDPLSTEREGARLRGKSKSKNSVRRTD